MYGFRLFGKEEWGGITMEQINDLKSRIDFNSLMKQSGNFDVSYNSKRDTLFMQLKNPPPAISVDCDGMFWLRVNPQNGEIVGIEIEGYRKVFLKRYHELVHMKPATTKPFVERISRELVGCLSYSKE